MTEENKDAEHLIDATEFMDDLLSKVGVQEEFEKRGYLEYLEELKAKKDMQEKGLAWAIERYKARYGDDPNETKCVYPFCDMSGHPATSGYCSCACEDSHNDMLEIEELEAKVSKLYSAIAKHKTYTALIGPNCSCADEELWEVLNE